MNRLPFSRLPQSHVPVLFGVSYETSAEARQGLQIIYGHCLLRDLRNAGVHLKAWDTLAGDQNHRVTQAGMNQ
jgi:hypothetical protein